MSLPDHIMQAAYRASNGELAWKRAGLPAALAALADAGHATLGGETWVVTGDGRWHGLVPDSGGGPPWVWGWDTAPRVDGESWPNYCRRTAAESARVMAENRIEDAADPAVRDRLFLNVTFEPKLAG